jgi:hypothetical protein
MSVQTIKTVQQLASEIVGAFTLVPLLRADDDQQCKDPP